MATLLDYPKAQIRMYANNDIERGFRLHACAKEPWTVEWIERIPPGSVLYDVGANVGSYSLIAAARGITTVAIEPSFANYNRLCENIILNGLEPYIIPLCIGLGDKAGLVLIEQELQPGYSGGSKRLRVPVVELTDLPTLFGVPFPTHIKVDVDGTEAEVIMGAGFLKANWLVEVQTGHEAQVEFLLGEPNAVYDERGGQKIQGMSMMQWDLDGPRG
jgi:FkbM family methyltransferase